MKGVWGWRHTEDGGFLKMCFPCSFEDGGPGVYMDLGAGEGGSSGPVGSGPGLRAPQWALSSRTSPSRWLPKQGTAASGAAANEVEEGGWSLRTGVGMQSRLTFCSNPPVHRHLRGGLCPLHPGWS